MLTPHHHKDGFVAVVEAVDDVAAARWQSLGLGLRTRPAELTTSSEKYRSDPNVLKLCFLSGCS